MEEVQEITVESLGIWPICVFLLSPETCKYSDKEGSHKVIRLYSQQHCSWIT